MAKPKFPDEPVTKPATRAPRQVSGAAPSAERKNAAEVPTMPPPRPNTGKHAKVPTHGPTPSAMRPRQRSASSATIDTVVADLKNDPRAEADDDENDDR